MNGSKIVTIDLWNTLIKIGPENARFLSRYLSSRSPLSPDEVNNLIKRIGSKFDKRAIDCGTETSSTEKLAALIEVVGADCTVNNLESVIHSDLAANKPIFIDEYGLSMLDAFLNVNGIRWAIASNSGFVSARIMTRVIELMSIDNFSSFSGAYFSESIGYAKPNIKFFEYIEDRSKADIILHLGDHLTADYKANLPSDSSQCVLFDHTNIFQDEDMARVTKFKELIPIVRNIL